MTASNSIQTSVEHPSIKVGDPPLRIYAQREGDRVTGRVDLPYETHGRTSCPIDYRSTRPDDPNTDQKDTDQDGIGDVCDPLTIPAVSEWGLVVMSLLVLGAGTVVLRRRRVAQM